jgi:pentapeptide MXKDX repeat protein
MTTKADPDMAKVLNALSKLGPKPIETLTPSEARKQYSATDAVKKVIKDEKLDVDPHDGLSISNSHFLATTTMLMCGSAFAQNSAGPAPQSDNMNKPGMTNSWSGMNNNGMNSGTTGTGMQKEGMSKDGMSKDGMSKDGMKKDEMKKDGMKKDDGMAKDGMKK